MTPTDRAWAWLIEARAAGRAGHAPPAVPPLSGEAAAMIDLLGAFAAAGPRRPQVLGHIGQSLDGRIATISGHSQYVTGVDNLCHLHRIRALADAVVVGAGTVAADDPQLTTRRVDGPNPVRVVLDPRRRLPEERHIFRDGAAPTLVLCHPEHARPAGAAEIVALEDLSPPAIIAALRARGCTAILIEGGGITISRFLAAGALDRLHVAVAPILVGSGVPAFGLPAIETLDAALRPPCRIWPMGGDVLFDLDVTGLRRPPAAPPRPAAPPDRRDGPPAPSANRRPPPPDRPTGT